MCSLDKTISKISLLLLVQRQYWFFNILKKNILFVYSYKQWQVTNYNSIEKQKENKFL